MNTENYRTLDPDEFVKQGDQMKHRSMKEWEDVAGMIGHQPKNYLRGYSFRRKIEKEVQP